MSDQTAGPDQLGAAAARRAAAAEAAAKAAAAAAPVARPDGRARKPFGTMEQKLAYPARQGFHRHYFNDEPGRLQRAIDAGYTHVKNEHGQNVSSVVGVARGGGSLIAYLMEIPEEWYRQDMSAQEAEYRNRISSIKQGRAPGAPSGADGEAQYVGRQGITIRDDQRR